MRRGGRPAASPRARCGRRGGRPPSGSISRRLSALPSASRRLPPLPSLPLKGGGPERCNPRPRLRERVGVGGGPPTHVIHDQSQGWLSRFFSSKEAIDGAFCKVSPTSSRPLSRQCLRKGSTSNLTTPPSGRVIVWPARSMVSRALAPFLASSISSSTTCCGSLIGRMPFLKQLL